MYIHIYKSNNEQIDEVRPFLTNFDAVEEDEDGTDSAMPTERTSWRSNN